MEREIRGQFRGVANIIKFNWHYYVAGGIIISVLMFVAEFFSPPVQMAIRIIAFLVFSGIVISLVVSWYVYDRSGLYSLNWLDVFKIGKNTRLVNIHAGFDETSDILHKKFPGAELRVFDFYDPAKHTEISIRRARKVYLAYPGTSAISTRQISLESGSTDFIFLLFAAHEIRNQEERVEFFRQLGEALKPGGRIIVLEHLRDIYNFIAYNFGFFHFYSPGTWRRTFAAAGLKKESISKLTPFLSIYVLTKDGSSA